MAAIEIPGFKLTLETAADLSASKFRAVKLDNTGKVVVITAITDRPVGILQDAPAAASRAAEIMVDGVSLMEAGSGGVTAGDAIMFDNTGKGITCTVGTSTTQYQIGQALSTAASGALFSVLFDCAAAGRAA